MPGSALTSAPAGWKRGRSIAACDSETVTQDPVEHADERRAQPSAARGADRELEAVAVEHERGGHHAVHALARHERARDQIGLAEHAVQVQVEAGQPVARAEPEARRQDAGVPGVVDHGEVRRVAAGAGELVEGREERVRAAVAARSAASIGCTAEPSRVTTRRPANGPACGGTPDRLVAGEIVRDDRPVRARPSARAGSPRSSRDRRTGRPRRAPARARGRAPAGAARHRLRGARRPARTAARPRASSSPARASRGTRRGPVASARRRGRGGAPVRRGAPTAASRTGARARRALPAPRARRTTTRRSRSARARRRTAPRARPSALRSPTAPRRSSRAARPRALVASQ